MLLRWARGKLCCNYHKKIRRDKDLGNFQLINITILATLALLHHTEHAHNVHARQPQNLLG